MRLIAFLTEFIQQARQTADSSHAESMLTDANNSAATTSAIVSSPDYDVLHLLRKQMQEQQRLASTTLAEKGTDA